MPTRIDGVVGSDIQETPRTRQEFSPENVGVAGMAVDVCCLEDTGGCNEVSYRPIARYVQKNSVGLFAGRIGLL